jgi:hypothetical protein
VYHSQSLETLKILLSEYDSTTNWLLEIAAGGRAEMPSTFPLLEKMSCPVTNLPYDYFDNCTFPELRYLKISKLCWQGRIDDIETLTNLTIKMPKIESLFVDVSFAGRCRERPRDLIGGIAPALKELRMVDCVPKFISFYRSTLQKLEIDHPVYEVDMQQILEDLTSLRSLSIYSLWRNRTWKIKKFSLNTSIETLKIEHIAIFSYGRETFRDLLMELPALEVLIVPSMAVTKRNLSLFGK